MFFDHPKPEIHLLKALIHLLDELLNQFSLVFERFFHPHHAFAQLNLIDSWWLAQADLSEPFAEMLLDEFDVFLRQAHRDSPEEWG